VPDRDARHQCLDGDLEVVADDFTRQVKAGLSLGIEARYPRPAQN
jgi:hypothetical protein